jgi:hypothetical protein
MRGKLTPRIGRVKAIALLCLCLAAGNVEAHLGPPYPILVDQPISGYLVTVLANPDVGQAVVVVDLEPSKHGPPSEVVGVDVWVQPVSGRLPKSTQPATLEHTRGRLEYSANPNIDAVESWKIGVDIHLAGGADRPFVAQVESTPPGIGPWGLLFFLFPFILFGGLWAMVFIRKSRNRVARKRITFSRSEAACAVI